MLPWDKADPSCKVTPAAEGTAGGRQRDHRRRNNGADTRYRHEPLRYGVSHSPVLDFTIQRSNLRLKRLKALSDNCQHWPCHTWYMGCSIGDKLDQLSDMPDTLPNDVAKFGEVSS